MSDEVAGIRSLRKAMVLGFLGPLVVLIITLTGGLSALSLGATLISMVFIYLGLVIAVLTVFGSGMLMHTGFKILQDLTRWRGRLNPPKSSRRMQAFDYMVATSALC